MGCYCAGEEDEESEEGEGAADGQHATGKAHAGFTRRTQLFLHTLQQASANAPAATQLPLSQLISKMPGRKGSGSTRGTAARCFFECLVLQNRGFAQLQQRAPFDDLLLTPTAAGLA